MRVQHLAWVAACLVAAAFGWTAPASAAMSTGSLLVQVNLIDDCQVSSTDGNSAFGQAFLDFGTQGALTTDVDSQTETSGNGALQIQCTTGVAYNIGLSAGINPATPGDVNSRRMTNSGNFVSYQLYSDSGRATVWGDTVGQDTVQRTATGQPEIIPIYGRIPIQTTPRRGLYSDTVAIVVTY